MLIDLRMVEAIRLRRYPIRRRGERRTPVR